MQTIMCLYKIPEHVTAALVKLRGASNVFRTGKLLARDGVMVGSLRSIY